MTALPFNRASDAGGLRLGVDAGCYRDVFDGNTQRLEERYVLGVSPARVAPDNHLTQFMHIGPVNGSLFERLDEIARLESGLVLAIYHDRLTTPHRNRVDFCLAQEVRADGIDMGAFGNPMTVKHGFAAGGSGDDDVLILGG